MESSSQQRAATILAVACGAPFLVALDLFVVNVAFDNIAADFRGAMLSAVSWTLSAYAIGYAALLIPLGSWSDRVGNRRGFIIGVAVFTAASALAAAAPTLSTLIVARVIQAVGAAVLTPASLALLVTSLPAERRAGAVRIWAASSGMAAAFGPVVGGLLVEISWRAAFLVNVPIGIAFVVGAWRVFGAASSAAETTGVSTARRPAMNGSTLLGAVLLAGASALGVLYVVQGADWHWGSARSWAVLLAAVVCAGGCLAVDRMSSDPLVPRALFTTRSFALGSAAMLAFSVAFAAGLLNAIMTLQQNWGYSVLRSGLAIAPGPLMVPLATVVAARLAHRISPWITSALGAALWGIGMILLGRAGTAPAYVSQFLPGWLVGGVGVGLVMPSLLANVTAHLDPAVAGRGSAVVSMARQLGTTIGTSALVALLAAGLDRQHTWLVIAGVAFAAAALAVLPPMWSAVGPRREISRVPNATVKPRVE